MSEGAKGYSTEAYEWFYYISIVVNTVRRALIIRNVKDDYPSFAIKSLASKN